MRPGTIVTAAAVTIALLGTATAAAADDDQGTGQSFEPIGYIVGGSTVTPADDTPWLAAILDGDEPDGYWAQICTGTLISPTHVLTAGHCVIDGSGLPVLENFDVAVGVLDLDDITPADRHAAVATAHPSWTGSGGVDLAILTLASPVPGAEPLMLATTSPAVGTPVTAYGWGGLLPVNRNDNTYPDEAQKGTMKVTTSYASTTGCGFGAGAVDHTHQFCFDDEDQAACFGDSGGPLVVHGGGDPELVGTVSQGATICNHPDAQEIAERIVDSLSWITELTGDCGWNPASAGTSAGAGWTVPCWVPPASGAEIPFVDVDFSSFYIEGVKWLWSNSITTGTSSDTFSPLDTVTRGQLAAFLWRFAGAPAATPSSFFDVDTSWQYVPVGWLHQWGITTGTSTDTYSPDDSVTRAQLVTFLWRLVGEPAEADPSGFPDVEAGRFYSEAVAWAAATGVTTGYPDGTFRPDQPVTRGEMATFLLRLALVVEAG